MSDPSAVQPVPWRTRQAAGSGVEYECIPTDTDLSHVGLESAIVAIGYDPLSSPVLVISGREWPPVFPNLVPGSDLPQAVAIALSYGMRIRIDPKMTDPDEWYIEWNGRRVGSPAP